MRYKIAVILFLCVLSFTLFSCGEKKPVIDEKLESYSKLSSPANNSAIKSNDSIRVSLNLLKKIAGLDSARISFDNIPVASLKNNETSFTWKPASQKLGAHKVSVAVFFSDGKKENLESNIRILSDAAPENIKFTVVKTYPHSKDDFTEGLQIHKGFLYESTGLEGKSLIKKTELSTGKVLKEVSLDKEYFGEGMTILDNKIYQLTWKNKKGFVYNLDDFKLIQNFSYGTEGWGMTNNGKDLIMSDGTSNIYFMNPVSFSIKDKIQVCDNVGAIPNINELEYHSGFIYANVWRTFLVIKIDPATGKVVSRINLEELASKAGDHREIDVLNGIAVNPSTGNLLVTGKFWTKIFEIKLNELPA